MYKKSWIPYGAFKALRIAHDSGAFFDCIPALGGQLFRLSLTTGDQLHTIIDPCHDPEDYQEYYSRSFHGSKLFPFPNRIENGQYIFNDKKFKFDKTSYQGAHAIHGLLSQANFEIKTVKHANEISLSYTLSQDSHEAYPYDVRCETIYSLEPDRLRLRSMITNLSQSNIPIGDGWHPYFNIAKEINHLTLKLPKVQSLKLRPDGIPTKEITNFETFSIRQEIGNENLDHAFILDQSQNLAETILENSETKLQLIIEQETGPKKYNYLQIYTPPDRKSIAIEPMTCAPNAFNNEMGLIILKAEESMELEFNIMIQHLKN